MHTFHHKDEGKPIGKDPEGREHRKIVGDMSLKGGVAELREDHEKGSPHMAVRDMKGLDRK